MATKQGPRIIRARSRGIGDLTVPDVSGGNARAIHASVVGVTRAALERALKRVNSKQTSKASAGVSQEQKESLAVGVKLDVKNNLVSPPYDLSFLSALQENSTELFPSMEAMAVNVDSFGWKLKPRIAVNEETPDEVIRILLEEAVVARNFFNCSGEEGGFEDLRMSIRKDLEVTGNGWLEFVEDPATGKLEWLNHLPARSMRISTEDEFKTEYTEEVVREGVQFEEMGGEVGGRSFEAQSTFEIVKTKRSKFFRRHVQVQGTTYTWFKELGDPRLIDSTSGAVVSDEDLDRVHDERDVCARYVRGTMGTRTIRNGNVGFPVEQSANPVLHLRLESGRSPYGLPRFRGCFFAIFGSRAADEINFTTFKNNQIPSMVITVSNGFLTQESSDRVQEFVETVLASDDNYSAFLILEAEPNKEGVGDAGTCKVTVQPLTAEQHTDAMFVNYTTKNDERTRRAWRLPPIFYGMGEDWSGKSIDSMRKLAEEQTFNPEREKFDRIVSRVILPRLGICWSTFKSLTPNVTDNAELIRLLGMGEKTGGITPRISRTIASDVFNRDLGEVNPELLNPDQPFSLTLAQIMKDQSEATAGGGEATSQGRAGLQRPADERDRENEVTIEGRREVERLLRTALLRHLR